ncbi:MAG: cytochrome c maturation protein CcmE [Saprospiraceae bacterium]
MKKIHLIGMIMIGIAIYLIITAGGEVATYANFEDARGAEGKVKVVGHLVKDKEIVYDELKDPNYFSFYMIDDNKEERKVILNQGKPQDFELSEQIVLTGKMEKDEFIASEILLKCPSKYKDEEVYLKNEKG